MVAKKLVLALCIYIVFIAILWFLPQDYLITFSDALTLKGKGNQKLEALTGRQSRLGQAGVPEDLIASAVTDYALFPDDLGNVILKQAGTTESSTYIFVQKTQNTSYLSSCTHVPYASLEALSQANPEFPYDKLTWYRPTFWSSSNGRMRQFFMALATVVLIVVMIRAAKSQPAPATDPAQSTDMDDASSA